LLQDSHLVDWGIAIKAVKSASEFVGFVQTLINELKPDIVVTEKITETCRKGKRARSLISAIADIASHNPVLDVSVERPRGFPSKYEEAEYLVRKHPELIGYAPKQKRRLFDFEPRGMVLFEALALALVVDHGS
ncbi:MAG: hypothetical protein GVY36_18220, partial [Verrucomicrobia bacterium]|nr:hypothetical protein [Verrucomicrobiota bacterium]